MRSHNHYVCKLLSVIVLGTALVGCSSRLAPPDSDGPPDNNNSSGDNANSAIPGQGSVLVRFVNETDVVVEAQFYATLDTTGGSADTLFVPQNLVIESIGVAATGLLIPKSADTIEWPCGEGLVLGVAGGRFLDRDTGAELGTGTARIIQHGLVFDCGATITFTYQESEYGFTVTVNHE